MANRSFTLEEAQKLLPVLESLLKSAMQAKAIVEAVDQEFQQVQSRVFLQGGSFLNIGYLKKRKAEKERAAQRVKDALAEIAATGVQVKDLDIGLLDFPCVVEERVILLCWKLGEKAITHWHGTEEGFAGRKPIDDTIARARPKKPN